ncbi:hypothetical protein BDR22DRAFT_919345 [Usnea florida]
MVFSRDFTDQAIALTGFEGTGPAFPTSSPAMQEFEEFEAFIYRALPQLVEANLQAMVKTEMVPIEKNLRMVFVDVVRRCQSIVAEKFRLIRESRVSTNHRQPATRSVHGKQNTILLSFLRRATS